MKYQALSSPSPTHRRPFMVACVGGARSHANSLAATKALKDVVTGTRHDALLSRVKAILRDSGRWPWQVEHKLPVIVVVEELDQLGTTMRHKLVEGLREALGLTKRHQTKLVSGMQHWS